MYTPVKPQFCYIKVGCKGVYITRTCFRDEFDSHELPQIDKFYDSLLKRDQFVKFLTGSESS